METGYSGLPTICTCQKSQTWGWGWSSLGRALAQHAHSFGFDTQHRINQMWSHMPKITATKRQRRMRTSRWPLAKQWVWATGLQETLSQNETKYPHIDTYQRMNCLPHRTCLKSSLGASGGALVIPGLAEAGGWRVGAWPGLFKEIPSLNYWMSAYILCFQQKSMV